MTFITSVCTSTCTSFLHSVCVCVGHTCMSGMHSCPRVLVIGRAS